MFKRVRIHESWQMRLVPLFAAILVAGLAQPAAAAPQVSFSADAPEQYVLGSEQAIDFDVAGEMPDGGDVLVLAWSFEEERVVDAFAHTLTAEPWRIASEYLDELPTGRVQLQLHRRVPDAERTIARHDIEVVAPSVSRTLSGSTQTNEDDGGQLDETDATSDQDTAPTVEFLQRTTRTYELGSGQDIDFTVDGEMPDGGDVLVLAWSFEEERVVDAFAHTLTDEPWRIVSEHLDELPTGRVQLQLHRRVPGATRTVDRHTIRVQAPSRLTVSFSADAPATYRQGSGGTIAFEVNGEMPTNGDVLALAWSYDEERMVDAFAHVHENEPWVIPAANLDELPTGRVQLQLHRRVPGLERTVENHTLDVLPPLPSVGFASSAPSAYERGSGLSIGLSVDGEMPANGSVRLTAVSQDQGEIEAFTHELSSEPWGIAAERLDTLPAGAVELRAERVIPGEETTTATHALEVQVPAPSVEVAFANPPSAYQQGSGQDIAYEVTGEMPDGGDVLVLAWSEDQGQMIDTFAHTREEEPWRIAAAHLDALPTGQVQLQLHRRVPGLERTVQEHWVEIEPADSTGDDDLEPPQVSFASDTPSVYRQGTDGAIEFIVDGELPEGGDVLVIAWSDAEQRMVDEFAHALSEGPWQISAEHMAMLPAGGTSLQLLTRLPDHDNLRTDYWLTIESASHDDDGNTGDDDGNTGDDDDGSTGDDGDTGDDGSAGDGSDDDDPWHDDDGGSAGWTEFEQSPDTRVVYVSSSEGDDANDGSSPDAPVETIDRAREITRWGYPDWMLLKAGDEWVEPMFGPRAGRSEDEPHLIGVYGDGPRPVIREGRFRINPTGSPVEHFALVGIEFVGPGNTGISFMRDRSRDILFEDIVVREFRVGIYVSPGGHGDGINDVRVRRSIVIDQYSGGQNPKGHANGIYTDRVDGLLIEECTFDHNGWNPEVSGANKTIFNHNIYLGANNRNVIVRRNITARASSHGMQVRPGGIVEDNLAIRNPLNIQVGATDQMTWPGDAAIGVVRNNVIIDAENIGDRNRGNGIDMIYGRNLEIYDNIIAHRDNGDRPRAISAHADSDGVTFRNNHIWNWGGRIEIDESRHVNLELDNNYFDGIRIDSSNFDGSSGSPSVFYSDPSRSIDSYMVDELHASAGSVGAFLDNARNRPHGVWNDAYTATAVNAYIRSGFSVLPTYD